MRISHHWMQEQTADRRSRWYPCRHTTASNDRRIVCRAMRDHEATSRTIAQQIQSVTHHSLSARTIRCHLLQSGISASHPLLRLPLTENHRHLRSQ
ncbi:transposable element Tc1 transposase [Trichonephila clavipes]|nr:transposable element Tc1 transposase [Trichonephila clavipes]